jgi:AcrR family transcriptional regulator
MAAALETVFKEYGYEGASLKLLAEAAALSKASLYHHFPRGKEEMAAHVLAHSGARLQKLVPAPLAGSLDGADCVRASLEGTAAYYAGDLPICLMNSLLLGEGRALFGERIAAAVAAWRGGIAACLKRDGWPAADADGWAGDALALVQGSLVLCRVEGARAPLDGCLDDLAADLAADGAPDLAAPG